jgi:hypothetical protein
MLTLEVNKIGVVMGVIQLIQSMVDVDKKILSHLCIMGLIPALSTWLNRKHPISVRALAAQLIKVIIDANVLTLQMFIACRGLPMLVELLDPNANTPEETMLNHLAVQCITKIFNIQPQVCILFYFSFFHFCHIKLIS